MSKSINSINNNIQKNEDKNNIDIKEIIEKYKLYKLPILKIQKSISFPTSSYSYFFISIGMFILGCGSTGWCTYGTNFINSVFLFLGICQYILGIYDWYQKNNILYMQNILFGIWYTSFFLNYIQINGLRRTNSIYSGMQGVTDLLILLFVGTIIVLVKGKGILYTIDYFLLFLSFAFLALCGYSNDYIIVIKIGGYVYFVTFVFFWITGMSLVINDVFNNKIIGLVEPRLN